MKRKKLFLSIFIPAMVIIVAVCSFLLYWTVPFCVFRTNNTSVAYSKENSSIISETTSLKILQFTDLHVNGALDMPVTFSTMKKSIYKSKPDMIVFTGDIFSSGSNKKDVKKFVKFIESFNIPWAAALGNHDDETPYSLAELSDILQNAKNSLFKTGNLSNLYGNYFYNITFSDNQKFQLIFMDTRYDGFTTESVQFYEHAIEESKNVNNGEALNNITFFHIPIYELNSALLDTQNFSIKNGQINEDICTQITNVGFFDKALQLGKTKAMIFGHDHINNAKMNYKGIDLFYGTKTGKSSYNFHNINGGTLYTLASDGQYSYRDLDF